MSSSILVTAIIWLLSSFLSPGAASAEPSLNSQYSRDHKVDNSRGIKRDRSIEVRHGRSHSNSTSRERSRTSERSRRSETTLSTELTTSIIEQIARFELNGTSGNPIYSDCKILTGPTFVPVSPDYMGDWQHGAVASIRGSGMWTNLVRGGSRVKYTAKGIGKILFCYAHYAALARGAIDSIHPAAQRLGVRLDRPLSKENISDLVDTALDMAAASEKDKAKFYESMMGNCSLPSIDMLMKNDYSMKCGPFAIDSQARTMAMSGQTYFSPEGIAGKSVKVTMTTGAGQTTAYAMRNTRSNERSGSINTGLSKHRTLGRNGASSTGASTQAGVTAKPQ